MDTLKTPFGDWITIEQASEFLNYKKTQFNKLLRDHPEIKRSVVGRRKFISKSSLIKFLDDHVLG